MITAKANNKANKWFETAHLKGDLKGRSVKGGFSTVGGQIVSFTLNISSTIIMARLLTPNDYGLVAMVTAITGFITIFKDLGLSAAVIQKEEIRQNQVSSIFWINALISFGIALLIAVLAPVLVYFYKESRLLNITLVFAIGMFITGLSLQHNALMKRQMKFQTLSFITIGCAAVSHLIGVTMAWLGLGYWAIVASVILIPVFTTIALWLVCDWKPNLYLNTTEVKSFLKFGAGITGFDLVNYFSRNMDNVLIGKFVGAGPLGLYTRAYQLLLLPITQLRDPLNAVALPALSTLQNEPERYRNFFSKYLFSLSFFSMPLVVFMGIFSEEIIVIILGKQWIEAGLIFKFLAISGFIQPAASTQGLVLITTGKVKKYFYLGVMNSTLVVTGFFIGVKWGVTGVAISYAVVNYIVFLPFLFYCLGGSPFPVTSFFKETAFPALFALLSGGIMLLFRNRFADLPNILLCGFGFIVGSGFYLSLWYTSQTSRQKFKQLLEVRMLLTKKLKR